MYAVIVEAARELRKSWSSACFKGAGSLEVLGLDLDLYKESASWTEWRVNKMAYQQLYYKLPESDEQKKNILSFITENIFKW